MVDKNGTWQCKNPFRKGEYYVPDHHTADMWAPALTAIYSWHWTDNLGQIFISQYEDGGPILVKQQSTFINTDSKVHGANIGPACVLSAPDGPHVGPMNLAIGELTSTGLSDVT